MKYLLFALLTFVAVCVAIFAIILVAYLHDRKHGCKYCQKVRDDNEYLIYDELNEEVMEAVQIRYKHDKFELWSGICFREINYCPMCGRKLR